MPPEDVSGAASDAARRLAPVFASRIATWQATHGRSTLPWQNTHDPYRVWLSEVMLQQTQVVTVLGYYDRFLERFPTVAALAAADEDAVFGLWSGLGYYSRARNMHRCAQDVMKRFDGQFPSTAASLETLPGIGRSTAAAIAAFCFGERVAILDGNVKRVLSRVLAFDGDLAAGAEMRALWRHADSLLPPADDPQAIRRYTQGQMDLGATVCLPRKPACLLCPVADLCLARQHGDPERYPKKSRTLRRSAQSLWMLRATDARGRTWLEKRPARGVWAGLYAVPMYEDRDALATALPAFDGSLHDGEPIVHALTHKDLHLHPVSVLLDASPSLAGPGRWMTKAEYETLGLPAPVRKLLATTR